LIRTVITTMSSPFYKCTFCECATKNVSAWGAMKHTEWVCHPTLPQCNTRVPRVLHIFVGRWQQSC